MQPNNWMWLRSEDDGLVANIVLLYHVAGIQPIFRTLRHTQPSA
jgi:hypothetical protein